MSSRKIKLKKRQEKASTVEQWIEVEVFDGITRTTRYPGDEEVLELIADKMEATGRPVELVYRRFNFVHGVPPEYHWTTSDPVKRQNGGHAIQRLIVNDWLAKVDDEAGGHLQSAAFHMPRPESRGVCDCAACRYFSDRIERTGR